MAEEAIRDGRTRVIIEGVWPEIDGGRFAAKRIVGAAVTVEADIFADGHDLLSARLLHRRKGSAEWTESILTPLVNDRWRGVFTPSEIGEYEFTLLAWVDHFATWHRDLLKRSAAEQDLEIQYRIGANLVLEAAADAPESEKRVLETFADRLRETGSSQNAQLVPEELVELMVHRSDRKLAVEYPRPVPLRVEPRKAEFSSWYEMFPRSSATVPGKHGTFRDAEKLLPHIAGLGFDILYLPPIHPIGTTHRKGRNNSVVAATDDPGSPWAIGSAAGGHRAVHPELGSLTDFDHFHEKARSLGIDLALDIAFQASPDHPSVGEHPGWFLTRPDGTIQYAENPPKKYQDIYPFHFESEQWMELWQELKGVFSFWVGRGIKIFRVDNPHTKPLPFWEWVIAEVKRENPEVIFLAEAFTRPRIMYYLAKAGFTQSYTYFTWRTSKKDLTTYFTELTRPPVSDFFRPNAWPTTPDILPEHLQSGDRASFQMRLVLAATLCASYGIYGPAFELLEHEPRTVGSEEYLDSEKYEIRQRDLDSPHTLGPFISRINRIRRENEALHSNRSLRFHPVDNERLICYSKTSDDGTNTVIVVVNLDPCTIQAGTIDLSATGFGIEPGDSFQLHDLLTDARFSWFGPMNRIEINPQIVPARIFRIRRRHRTERDFEYYL